MRLTKNIGLVVVIFLAISSCTNERPKALVEKKNLTSNWIFRDSSEPDWYPANVPGTVHTDLKKNGIIDDPFFGCNEEKLQWIGVGTIADNHLTKILTLRH
ncbi:MAG: hypothetical protein PHT92_12390 [Bacteroidales bacterium]|nr:hypothetical protein [Bacteroidales bacterium]